MKVALLLAAIPISIMAATTFKRGPAELGLASKAELMCFKQESTIPPGESEPVVRCLQYRLVTK